MGFIEAAFLGLVQGLTEFLPISSSAHLRIVGEFDDSALVKSFGQAGAGLFVAPTAIAGHVCEQYKVAEVGRIDAVLEQVYAITTERRLTHPAVVAISKAARQKVFKVAGGPSRRKAADGDR